MGIDNAKDMLEIIPNKITDTMGIIVDVNHLQKGGLEYLQIVVEKYPSLISFHGKYYYRSGSTMHEITGKELERTLLKTQGRTWDGVPLPKLSVVDLKQDAIQLFKEKAVKRGRLTKEKVDSIISDERIMSEKMSELKKEPIIKIMSYLKDNEEITTTKGMEITGKSAAQVRRYLKALSGLGIIKSTRSTKGNVYVKV